MQTIHADEIVLNKSFPHRFLQMSVVRDYRSPAKFGCHLLLRSDQFDFGHK